MTVWRLIAVVVIFMGVTAGWMILGTSVQFRTDSGFRDLGIQVQDLWGSPHTQSAPVVHYSAPGVRTQGLELDSGDVDVDLKLDHRRKGLLWYSTYDVGFRALYTIHNPLEETVTATVTVQFPSYGAMYDDFVFRVRDVESTPNGDINDGLISVVDLAPGEEVEIELAYKSRGMDRWRYSFSDGVTTVRDFVLTVNTDFDDYDFPSGTISASEKNRTAAGWELVWDFQSLVSDFDIGVEMPHKLNPGDLASRMSYFAPVSLMFFFTVLIVLGVVRSVALHPMHYFFLGASFFAFHLLFAYLVDHIAIELAFIIAAVVSLGLVLTYLGRVTGWRFALREAALSQFLFLVMFSYAFFFEGYTGLVVTIGAVITLAILMQVSAKVDWTGVFKKNGKGSRDRVPVVGDQGL